MRQAFIDQLIHQAELDPKIFLLTADLGWSILEPFATRFPDRYLNVGVAEQNMQGIATGLAREGFVPFVYSISTFASMRGFEQFRDGAILHQLPVRVIGIGGGFSYGHAGPTHHGLEDLTLGRTQPGLTVIAPADEKQATRAVEQLNSISGPAYLRIDKANLGLLPGLNGRFRFNEIELIRETSPTLFLATGSISHEVFKAIEYLNESGIDVSFGVLAHLPFTASHAIRETLSKFSRVITVEEGHVSGGLASLIAEAIAEEGLNCRLTSMGVKQTFLHTNGSTSFMRTKHRLDWESLALTAEAMIAQGLAI
jgi:transketolase